MNGIVSELSQKITSLTDGEKLELVDSILNQLDPINPEIDKIWAEEADRRWQAYKDGKLETVSYEEVMQKYHTP